jgi:hypothetical protein
MGSKEVRQYCKLDSACTDLLKMAMTKLGLSARAYDRILLVSLRLKSNPHYCRSLQCRKYFTPAYK